MCTIVILHRFHRSCPLVIAATRDELYAREAAAPLVLRQRDPRAVGGRDIESGGTWLGVNDAGLLVAMTNQRSFTGPDPALASRGPVVVDALGLRSMMEIRDWLAGLDPSKYNEFNLLYGDGEDLEVAYFRRDERLRVEVVPPGTHVLPNGELDEVVFPKVRWLRDEAADLADAELDELGDRLIGMISSHRLPELEELPEPPADSRFDRAMLRRLSSVCNHTEKYGTRSASIVMLEPGRVLRYLFGDGPPCRALFHDHLPLLSA